jgi:hypothetical protein
MKGGDSKRLHESLRYSSCRAGNNGWSRWFSGRRRIGRERGGGWCSVRAGSEVEC